MSAHTVVPCPGFCGTTIVTSAIAEVNINKDATIPSTRFFIYISYTKSILALLKNIPHIAALTASVRNISGSGSRSKLLQP